MHKTTETVQKNILPLYFKKKEYLKHSRKYPCFSCFRDKDDNLTFLWSKVWELGWTAQILGKMPEDTCEASSWGQATAPVGNHSNLDHC